jgi:hypothetical protein
MSGLWQHRRMTTRAMILFAVLASTATAAHADGNAAHPWAKWAPGAWVRTKSGIRTISVESKVTLVSVANGEVTTKVEMSGIPGMAATPPPQTEKRRIGYSVPSLDNNSKRTGEETITVAGKPYFCTIWTWVGPDPQGGQAEVREWRAPGVPYALKTIETARFVRQQMVIELTIAALSDPVDVAGKKVKAVRYEGAVTMNGKPIPLKRWVSSAIPGGVARELRVRDDGSTSETTVLAFGTK